MCDFVTVTFHKKAGLKRWKTRKWKGEKRRVGIWAGFS